MSACSALWLAGVGGGAKMMWDYQTTPGAPGSPPKRWPAASRVERRPGRATLLLMAHPQCPCSRATIGELSTLVAELGERATVHVLVFKPRDFPSGWERSDIWTAAARIPGVSVRADEDGEEAARFGAATSGQLVPKGEGYVTVSIEEFVAMPLDQRVSLVLEQRIRFYDEGGTLLSTAEGLKLLRQMRHADTPAAT